MSFDRTVKNFKKKKFSSLKKNLNQQKKITSQ